MRMVYLGAAYAPCMRQEPDVMVHVAEIRKARAGEGQSLNTVQRHGPSHFLSFPLCLPRASLSFRFLLRVLLSTSLRPKGCCTRQGGQFCYAAKESECGGTQTYHNNTECMGAICCVDPSDYPGTPGLRGLHGASAPPWFTGTVCIVLQYSQLTTHAL